MSRDWGTFTGNFQKMVHQSTETSASGFAIQILCIVYVGLLNPLHLRSLLKRDLTDAIGSHVVVFTGPLLILSVKYCGSQSIKSTENLFVKFAQRIYLFSCQKTFKDV